MKTRWMALISTSVAALCGVGAVAAGPLEDGVAALDNQDYDKALKLLKPLAEQGVAAAQFKIGSMYSAGAGVAEDDAQGLAWTRKAVAQGYAPAKAWMLLMCNGPQSPPAADCDPLYAEVKAKAQAGDPPSEVQLGTFYLLGKAGLAKDPAQGVDWIHRAADKGDITAERQLGLIYSNSFMGVKEDQDQSLTWYRKAADQGDVAAMDALAIHYQMNLDGAADAKTQAAGWYLKAAAKGDIIAQSSLAKMYEDGDGVDKDPAQAVVWYRKLADRGLPDAEAKVGSAYAFGRGIAQDYLQAYVWLDLSIAQAGAGGLSDADNTRLALNAVAGHLTAAQIADAKRQSAAIKARQDAQALKDAQAQAQ
jgi:TPR repeat protein